MSNIAVKETFIDPMVEAGPAGTGFAVWGHAAGGSTTVRMVPLDPHFEAGRAVLTGQKRVKGLKVTVKGKRRCVAKSAKRVRKAPAKKRCKTWKKIGSIRKPVKAGRNTIVFSGRLAGRKLGPGRCRALLKITDLAGNVSRAEAVKFRVMERKRGK